jgi:anti-anti-sigma factor
MSDAAPLVVDVLRRPGGAIMRLRGELDLSNVSTVRDAVTALLATAPEHLTFDLAALRFMDSSGLAVLLQAAQKVPSVTLRNPSDIIKRVLETTGLSEVLPIEP